MSSPEPEILDSRIYSGVAYYRETVEFICKALGHYIQQIKSELAALESDPVLGELLGDELNQDSEITREIEYMTKCKEYFEGNLEGEHILVSLGSLSHGLVRKLKSISLRYLDYLQHHRDQFSSRRGVSGLSLKAVDARLTSVERSLASGVFANATPLPLLVDDFIDSVSDQVFRQDEESLAIDTREQEQSQIRRPVVLSTIEINDQELRRRCLDLVIKFHNEGDEHRLDSVVREATVVLENRLRELLHDEDGTPVLRLIDIAFGNDARVPISSVPAERQGVHALFRGVFGFVRNRHHHRLSAELQIIEVLQIIGFVDYLLSLLEGHAISDES